MYLLILCYPGALQPSIFERSGILHLFGALKVRITQTKYFGSEVGVEIVRLSSGTQGSISSRGHTATDSPLCPTFHSMHVAIFKMTLLQKLLTVCRCGTHYPYILYFDMFLSVQCNSRALSCSSFP